MTQAAASKARTLLILGGNRMAIPAIRRIREHGYRVIVIDGSADAPAAAECDVFVHQNFSDVPATLARLASLEFDGLMPLNDFAIHAAAQAARQRGLPGWNEFAELCFTSKVAMKQAWTDYGLPTARWTQSTVAALQAGDCPAWDSWPAVVKPSFSGGGSRGVFLAADWAEVQEGLSTTGARYLDGQIVIEEFIDGSEHTLEVISCRGVPTLLSISDKQNYAGSVTVVQNLYFPGPVGNRHHQRLQELVYAACRAMQLTDGTAHFEVLIRHDEPYLLEVGGRPGGGLNFQPICELSTGYDYPGLLAAVATGVEPDFTRRPSVHLAWHYFPAGSGDLRAIEGFDDVRREADVVDAEVYETPGKPRFTLADDLARPGYVLVQGPTHEAARARAVDLVNRVRFIT